MSRRTCSDCGKPLGSTKEKCHECGGESFRGDRGGGKYNDTSLLELLRKFGL